MILLPLNISTESAFETIIEDLLGYRTLIWGARRCSNHTVKDCPAGSASSRWFSVLGTSPRRGTTSMPTSSVVEGDLSNQGIEFGLQRRTKTLHS
jgi:hypothetical protein